MKVKLLEPLRVPESLIEELAQPIKEAGHEFVYYDEKTTDPAELAERSKDADIVMIANNPYPKEAIDAAENLQLINVAFTGFDHVDMDAANERGIKVSNAAGYSDDAVAELVIGLTVALYRKMDQGNRDIRQEDPYELYQGREIKGKTVGVIGTGKIGQQTARLFHAFGVKLLGYNRSEKEEMKELGMDYVSLEELLQESDIVTIHLPSNEETKNLLDGDKLALMKEDAVLINCARGPIVDYDALADLLNADKIGGAGLDVYNVEPPLPQDMKILDAKNTILSPHIAYLTDEAMVSRAEIAFANTMNFIKGQPTNIVND